MVGTSIQNWIDYKKSVGVEGLHHVGIPGSGKSNFGNSLVVDCLEKGECAFIPGDRFCEWRHFLRYPDVVNKITVIVPKGQDILYHGGVSDRADGIDPEWIKNRFDIKFEFRKEDYSNLQIFPDILNDQSRREIIVVYDNHYMGLNLWQRARLWVDISKQLIQRTVLLNKAITLFFHEAGILWQQQATGQHWQAVHEFSELLVEFRKGLIRTQFLSQIETEIESTIRNKCLWKIYRKGHASRRAPRAVQKNAPFQRIDQYIVMDAGLYTEGNTTSAFEEVKEAWKMIPQGEPPASENESPVDQIPEIRIRQNIAMELINAINDGATLTKGNGASNASAICRVLGVSKHTISNRRQKDPNYGL